MGWRDYLSLFKEAFNEWNANNVPRFGAALAYFSIFAIAPLLIIALALGALIFGEEAAHRGLQQELAGTLGAPVAAAMESMLASSNSAGQGIVATVIGFIVLIIGAGGVFAQLQDALNVIFKAPAPPGQGLWHTLRTQFFSVAMVLGTGFLLLVSLVINTVLAALGKFFVDTLPGGVVLWQAINFLISLAVISCLFALIYRYVPNTRIAWRSIWPGAILTAILFTVGKFVLGWYLGQASTTSSYGAAASLVVILIWVYYASQIMLYGAAFTRVHASHFEPVEAPTNAFPRLPRKQGEPVTSRSDMPTASPR